ncbi:hypothetical protein [Desulfitobacterium sp. AusDCA]|uniref:hypothetical protein n=1 Tax=Desulfitobacterium sp. AusDCA TaxID=3240383 RepID=UPI003DA72635
MNETKGIFRQTRSGREEALKRLKAKERTRGSDQEYAEVLYREYRQHESLRRRAKDVAPRFDS